MSELPSALGIEAVEWSAQAGGSVTVSVIGRWRRRRPSWGGQPQLVIEAAGTRHRFPAMPEPPSLVGAAPGTWRLSFSVPAALAPHLGDRVWLQFGAVVVPLPTGSRPPSPPEPPPLPEARDRTADLQAQVERLERSRRIAEQRAHAEHALRIDLEEDLARLGAHEHTARQLTEAEERIRQLEDEVGLLRRRLTRRAVDSERAAATRAELAAARRRVPAPRVALTAPATLPHRLLDAERRMVEQRRADPRQALLGPLQRLRAHLRALRREAERETARRADAERRVSQAYDAIAVLREQLGGAFAPEPAPAAAEPDPEPVPDPSPPLEAERFELALERLRQATPPREPQTPVAPPEPEAEPRTWFGRLVRRLLGGAQSG